MSPYLFAMLLVLLAGVLHLRRRTASPPSIPSKISQKLPPGPGGLPIIGSLHKLSTLPHRSLRDMAKKYGPIMSIRLGSVPTIVVSSPQAAELFLKTHDAVFASRPIVQASLYLSYGTKGMAFTPYGSYWRSVRKFCTLELLTTAKIDSMAGMRREELGMLVESLKRSAAAREVVDFTENVTRLIQDMTCRMLFGRSRDDRFDLNCVIEKLSGLIGAFNLSDYVPYLAPFDFQGLTRQLKQTSKVIDKILETIIDEHEKNSRNTLHKHNKDFIDVMLAMKNNPRHTHEELSYKIDRTNIKAILLDMVFGAVDTSHTSIEWIMSELIKKPRVMKRVQEELKTVLGANEIVEEKDLTKLEYLTMVVKESLRLHPVAPLLVPRESMENIVVGEYYIPKKSRVIINSWAIGHDPNVWSENVEEFLPERFIGRNKDLWGRDFELLPFGAGRRSCPGMHLGLTNIRLVVTQLVHCFDWELPNDMSPNDLDMSEKFGLSVSRAKHLLIVPRYHL